MKDSKLNEKFIPTRIVAGLDSPKYYSGGVSLDIQVIDLLEAQGHGLSFAIGSAVKYIMRADRKDGEADLEKAQWFLDWIRAYNKRYK